MPGRFLGKLRRRPFPRNLRALRQCRISYAQFGEDLFLTSILGYEKTDGTYVDVGCYHPIDYSNTYIFYQRGWTGVTIDPNPRLVPLWRRYRPRDQFVNCAVSTNAGTRPYAMNVAFPPCNRLVDATPPASVDSPAEDTIAVECRPLGEILTSRLRPGSIDLLSIDCEGRDLDVLTSHDFSRWRPRVVVVEDTTPGADSAIARWLAGRDYASRAQIGVTKIFESTVGR